MSHIFQISDEQYAKLAAYAAQSKQTPETLFQNWVGEVTDNGGKLTSPIEQVERKVQEGQEEEILNSPILQVAGMFAIGEPGWADKHDEYLTETYVDNHADEK